MVQGSLRFFSLSLSLLAKRRVDWLVRGVQLFGSNLLWMDHRQAHTMRICRALLNQVAVTYLSLTIRDGIPTTLRCATLTKVLINLKTDCSTTFLWGNSIKKDLNLHKAQRTYRCDCSIVSSCYLIRRTYTSRYSRVLVAALRCVELSRRMVVS